MWVFMGVQNRTLFQKHLWTVQLKRYEMFTLNEIKISKCMDKIFYVYFQIQQKISCSYIERYDFNTALKF